MSVRVRFAPSPTGALHIGGIRTALYNYLLAKKHGGTFILRIEDTDQHRYVPGAEAYIIEALQWCGIPPTEGQSYGGEYSPYRQSERNPIYRQYVEQLLRDGHAYYAFDTVEEIEAMRQRTGSAYNADTRNEMNNSLTCSPEAVAAHLQSGADYTVRMKIPKGIQIYVHDLIRGEVHFNSDELDDKVLLKADGMPTYHLANVVDDHLMKITHVIRGEEWLPSAAHHVLLYNFFSWENTMPAFSHLPLILKPTGSGKLSKRDGAKFGFPVFPLSWNGATPEDSFVGFREEGFLPQALINFLALLGWSSGTDQEIFSLEELAALFSLEKINKAGARFDYEKAKWFNQQYLLRMDATTLAQWVRPFIEKQGYAPDDAFLTRFCSLMRDRCSLLTDFGTKGYYFFEPVREYDMATLQKKWQPAFADFFDKINALIASMSPYEATHIEEALKNLLQENNLKPGDIFPMLRIALAGTMQGPAVFDMMELLGKTESIARIDRLVGSIKI
ncbi:MAG: glutamate--tRNA ligase [Saprospiraceae bacterium]|nr:glutamate--tRNA ligase [Saprospiraceae bacterium]MBP7680122.1 glutamate--tRNA ligase [Saprospiraceae bacterium]